jgi:hypothetical protein
MDGWTIVVDDPEHGSGGGERRSIANRLRD